MFTRKSLTALGLAGAAAASVAGGAAHAHASVCRSDPIVTLSNGERVQLIATINADPAQVSGVNYVLHLPKNLTVSNVQYDDSGIPETFSSIADQPPVDQYGDANFTAQTTALASLGAPVTAYSAATAGIIATQNQVNGTTNRAVNQKFSLQPRTGNSTCLGSDILMGSLAGTLTVPAGVTCQVQDLTVAGQVNVGAGGVLQASNLQVNGSITLAQGAALSGDTVSVDGNLQTAGAQAANPGAFTVSGLTVNGNVNLVQMDPLQIDGASVSGSFAANGLAAGTHALCGLSVTGRTTLGAVARGASLTVGDPANGCDAGAFSGGLTVPNNAGTLTVNGNTVTGDLIFQGNTGSVTASSNTIAGNLNAQGNRGTMTLTGNTIGRSLSCDKGAPGVTSTGNTVTGANTCG